MQLEINAVTVNYREQPVVREVSFRLPPGGLGCLLGPSGCGKTTLLRAIAGFEPVTGGQILLGKDVVSAPGQTLAPERRGVGMVFQDFALFPHLTVADNIGFGLRGWGKTERALRIEQLLALIGLAHSGRLYPHQLSGGQQQRVALGRALAPKPRVLLLDEPFSGLDSELREALAREVRGILRQEGITALMVTHDQLEAFAWADEIGVMNGGRIMQWGSGYDLYHQPADRFVADFIGQGVLLRGTVREGGGIDTALGLIPLSAPTHCGLNCQVEVLVRPDDVTIGPSGVSATVVERFFRGAEFLYTLRLPGDETVLCLMPSDHRHEPGEQVHLQLQATHLVLFPHGAGASAQRACLASEAIPPSERQACR